MGAAEMNMRRFASVTVGTVLMGFGLVWFLRSVGAAESTVPIIELDWKRPVERVDVQVMDWSVDFTNLVDAADLIIEGQVVGQEPFGVVAVANKVKISDTLKGKASGTIRVIEPGTLLSLQLEKTYVLFLKKQGDGQADTYYVSGLVQGIFFEDEKGRMNAKDAEMLQKVSALLEDNMTLGRLKEVVNDHLQRDPSLTSK